MTQSLPCLLVSQDPVLQSHWHRALAPRPSTPVSRFADLPAALPAKPCLVWLDLDMPGLPAWTDPAGQSLLHRPGTRVVATSSHPREEAAIAALDAGCAGYCQAYAAPALLAQVAQVVEAGHVWIGPALVQRLIQQANQAAARVARPPDWAATLTPREAEVARMAATGASNQQIAEDCGISERTVKAHLSAIFDKLGLTDRLQLALRVHGIAR